MYYYCNNNPLDIHTMYNNYNQFVSLNNSPNCKVNIQYYPLHPDIAQQDNSCIHYYMNTARLDTHGKKKNLLKIPYLQYMFDIHYYYRKLNTYRLDIDYMKKNQQENLNPLDK